MRAAICYQYHESVVIKEVTLDPPAYGEVKVKMAVAGICRSAELRAMLADAITALEALANTARQPASARDKEG